MEQTGLKRHFQPTHRLIISRRDGGEDYINVMLVGRQEAPEDTALSGSAYAHNEWDYNLSATLSLEDGAWRYHRSDDGSSMRTVLLLEDGKPARSEVEALKRQWQADPCWDLENTTGFAEHREELLAYRKHREEESDEKQAAELDALAEDLGVPSNRRLAAAFRRLELRLHQAEARILELESR